MYYLIKRFVSIPLTHSVYSASVEGRWPIALAASTQRCDVDKSIQALACLSNRILGVWVMLRLKYDALHRKAAAANATYSDSVHEGTYPLIWNIDWKN